MKVFEVSNYKPKRDEIETLPEGLYELDEPSVTRDVYDVSQHVVFPGCKCIAMLRIDQGVTCLPQGVEASGFRSDGARFVIVFVPAGISH